MKFNTDHLDKIYNCNWIINDISPSKIVIICEKCNKHKETNLDGNALQILIEFYNDFYAEHGECE